MITIDHYTGCWQSALQPTPQPPRAGSLVRISESADAREYDDFCQILYRNNKYIEFHSWMPKLKMNVYKIVWENHYD